MNYLATPRVSRAGTERSSVTGSRGWAPEAAPPRDCDSRGVLLGGHPESSEVTDLRPRCGVSPDRLSVCFPRVTPRRSAAAWIYRGPQNRLHVDVVRRE